MPRVLKNLDLTLGLAVIPVQMFTATSSQGVAFAGAQGAEEVAERPRRAYSPQNRSIATMPDPNL